MNFCPREGRILVRLTDRTHGKYPIAKVMRVSGYSTIPLGVEVVVFPHYTIELQDGLSVVNEADVLGWLELP